jgi:hypothetical protein
MPQVDEVLDGGLHARAMVVDHGAGAQPCGELAVDQDHRLVGLGDGVDRDRVRLARERQDHAVDPTAVEEPDVLGIEGRLVLRVHEQQRIARLPEHGLRPQHDLRHERVRDVGEHEADRERLAAAQALGQEVGLVLQPLHGVEHALAHLGAHVGMARQDARHGRDGDPGEVRDLPHAGASPDHTVPITLSPVARSRCCARLVRTAHPDAPPATFRPGREVCPVPRGGPGGSR